MARHVRSRSLPGRRRLTRSPAGEALRILLVFLDGVGIGPDDADRNPFSTAHIPVLRRLNAGAPPVQGRSAPAPPAGDPLPVPGGSTLRAVDAGLGVPGRPQSGTGQTALLTGLNAPELLGRHFGPWVPTALRDLLVSENVLRRALAMGASVAFANSYPAGHMEPGGRGARRPGAMPLAASSAGLMVRDERSVREGTGLVSSITTETWRRYVDPEAPVVTPGEAGERLARIAARTDLTLFAHYDTDYVGHRGSLADAVAAVERVDSFLGGIVQGMSSDTLVLVASDHGNIEDVNAGHTENPTLFVAMGREHSYAAERVRRISDLAPLILEMLEARSVEGRVSGGGKAAGGPT